MVDFDEADRARIHRASDDDDASRYQDAPAQGMAVIIGTTVAGVANDQQAICLPGRPTGGTWLLKGVAGSTPWTSSPLPWNATAAQVLAALTTPYGAPQVAVAGTSVNPGPVTVTFGGSLLNKAVAAMTADGSGLTGPKAPYEVRILHLAVGESAYPTSVAGPFRIRQIGVSGIDAAAIGAPPIYADSGTYLYATNNGTRFPALGTRLRMRWFNAGWVANY